MSRSLTNRQIADADDSPLTALHDHGASLAVMLGHRPTRLSAECDANKYMSTLAGRLTAKQLPNGQVILLLWVFHPSIEKRVNWDTATLNQMFVMVPIIVHTIERMLYSMDVN